MAVNVGRSQEVVSVEDQNDLEFVSLKKEECSSPQESDSELCKQESRSLDQRLRDKGYQVFSFRLL